jgi:hypothetical protein
MLAVAFAFLCTAPPARATLEIALQEAGVNGGAITVVASTATDFSSVSTTTTYGDFTVTIFGGSSTNAATKSSLLSSTVSIVNNNAAKETLQLWVSQNNYTLPAGTPLAVESGLGATVNLGTVTLTGIFQAWADKNNNLMGTADFTNGPQNAAQTGSTLDTGSANGSFSRTGMYSVTSMANFVMSGGGNVNFADHVNLAPPVTVPAPAGVLLALTGLPVLGIGGWLRRRKTERQTA